jgi:hypothetical protein
MTSTIIETNLPGLDKSKEEGEEEHGVRGCVQRRISVAEIKSGGARRMKKTCNWIKDHPVLFFLDPKREREREREREVLVPVLKISLGSDPVLLNLDRNL